MSAIKSSPTPIRALKFHGQSNFRKEVTYRVESYLEENNLPARDLPAMYFKTACVFAWWLGSYLAILFAGLPMWANALLCVSFGLASAGIGFNVMHDANHDGYSKNRRANKILGWSVELIGFSSFIWRQQHNIWHHTYTNISGLDEALEAEGSMRWSPRNEWKPFFRFQHLYWPFIYASAAASLLLFRNFRVYFTGSSGSKFQYPVMSTGDKVVFWAFRLVNLLVLAVIPLFFFSWYEVLIGFFLSVTSVGLVMITILQLAHIMATVDFPEPTGDPLAMENEWAIHQVRTTTNFAPRNALLNWYVGGLNLQIEHHLFPQICHLNYPKIAPIVRQVCEEYGVPYRVHPTLWAALVDHYCLLKWLGQKPEPAPEPEPRRALHTARFAGE